MPSDRGTAPRDRLIRTSVHLTTPRFTILFHHICLLAFIFIASSNIISCSAPFSTTSTNRLVSSQRVYKNHACFILALVNISIVPLCPSRPISTFRPFSHDTPLPSPGRRHFSSHTIDCSCSLSQIGLVSVYPGCTIHVYELLALVFHSVRGCLSNAAACAAYMHDGDDKTP